MVAIDEWLTRSCEPDREYVDGKLFDRNVGEPEHSATVGHIAATLYNRKRESGIHVFPSLRVQVSATRFQIPDITVTKQKGRGKILREPPFLCIEILSPEDRAGQMQEKLDDYLTFGVRYVWVIDPRRKKAWSYSSEGKRDSCAVLTTSDPQLTVSLDEVFAAVAEDLEE
jgi:Uma2 family endonuclease